MISFKKAERKQVKLKLGISGPSGSGKTFSALKIARGIMEAGGQTGRIALIDTENKSASLYAESKGMPEFEALELEPPYTVDKYIEAMELAIKEKFDFLIVDSVSHVWSGEGGLLQEKESLDARGGNSYTNWAKMTPKWNRFVSAILHSDIHMICTMRSKQDYVLETNEKGKQAPKKVGMAPQVREGFEYELTAVFDMDISHHAVVSKDRTGLFDGRYWKPNEKTGSEIYQWLTSGKVAEPAKPAASAPEAAPADQEWKAGAPQLDELRKAYKANGWTSQNIKDYMTQKFRKDLLSHYSREEYQELLAKVKSMKAPEAFAEILNQGSGEADVP